MYRSRFWTMRQYAGYGTAAEANERFKYLLSQGQTGLSVAFDLATQIGYDSRRPRAAGEVGQAGVAIDSLADMEALLDGHPAGQSLDPMTINAPAAVLLAMVIVARREAGRAGQRAARARSRTTSSRNMWRGAPTSSRPVPACAWPPMPWPSAPARRRVGTPSRVSGYHIRDAGSTAAQEMGFAIANALAYIDAVLERGIGIDDFAAADLVDFQHPEQLLRGGGQVPGAAAAVGAHPAR